jgi:phosphoglycolate phosphatase-like HAD superfamily hydrolase
VKRELGKSIRLSDLTFEAREKLSPSVQEILDSFFVDKEAILLIPPYPSSLAGVRLLHEAGYKIHVVSSRKSPTRYYSRDWLEVHGFGPFIAEVHPRDRDLSGPEFKLVIAQKTQAEATFDDQIKIARTLAQNGILVYLVSRPWNLELKRFDHVLRVRSFLQGAQVHVKNHS